jgi:hypothetical protein
MKFEIKSSADVESSMQRAHELRKEYIAQLLRAGMAALSRLIHGSRHAAESGINGVSATLRRDASACRQRA